MSVMQVKEFYDFTFQDESIQRQLIETTTIDEFVAMAVKLGKENGYIFSKEDLTSTLSGFDQTKIFDDVNFGNEWIKKIMQIGWVPAGYTR